ncbi:helix-turn-helix domain-containing protein [Bradyrhizobium sp. McL0615]|uniref:helix-turn-helix domain-containing protein n=1 Tax=Bradyrhizobium sp. McL0615 TaxID=3415673 RepID=UPI003CEC7BDD
MHSSNEPLPTLLRYREAARELGVCERQIYNLVDQNLLEKVKLGTKTARITRTSVLTLAAQRATEPPTAA